MRTVPGMLRGQSVKQAPTLCMTATATSSKIEELKVVMGLRDINTVVLSADPVQSQFNIVRIVRPPNIRGTSGIEEMDGTVKPGLVHVMKRLLFDSYAEKIKKGEPVKRSLWLCRNTSDVADLYDELCEMMPEQAANPLTCPFVMNHSSVGPITAENIRKRRSSINLYLATSVMLLGLDLEDVDIIGMIRPFNHCHDLLQAAGRGGRKLGNLGKRRKVVFYVLFNKSDISNAVPGLTEDVKEFCETDGCLKMFLRRKFGFLHQNQTDSAWCCSNCS